MDNLLNINPQLLEYQYYLDRMSMFLNESYGINNRIKILHSLLITIDEFWEEILKKYNVMDNNYYTTSEEKTSLVDQMLDYIGLIFECRRNLTVTYTQNDQTNRENITLNNEEFLTYIKCQIIKQNFDGTREELYRLYQTDEVLNYILGIYYLVEKTSPSLNVRIIWSNYETYSLNLQKLFLGGYLTIESIGIIYNRALQNITKLAIFNQNGFNKIDNYDEYIQVTTPVTSDTFTKGEYYILTGGLGEYEKALQYDSDYAAIYFTKVGVYS